MPRALRCRVVVQRGYKRSCFGARSCQKVQLPAGFVNAFAGKGLITLRELPAEERAQRVCDYIAGITDRYAVTCFDRYAVTCFDRYFVPKSMRAVLL